MISFKFKKPAGDDVIRKANKYRLLTSSYSGPTFMKCQELWSKTHASPANSITSLHKSWHVFSFDFMQTTWWPLHVIAFPFFWVFFYNTNLVFLIFLYKIDIESSLKVSAKKWSYLQWELNSQHWQSLIRSQMLIPLCHQDMCWIAHP